MLRRNDLPEFESPGLLAALGIFRRRFAFVVLGVLACASVAGVYCWTTPTIYQSSAQIHLVHQGGALLSPSGESRALGSFEEANLATHMMILESEEVVGEALARDNLKNLESIKRALDTDQDEVEYVIENLRVNRGSEGEGRSAHVITVRLRHTSAEDCAAILRSVIASYSTYVETKMSAHMTRAREMIEAEKQAISREREAGQKAYLAFINSSPSLIRKDGVLVNMHQEQIEHLKVVLSEMEMRKIELESRLQTVKDILSDAPRDDELGFERLALLKDLTLRGHSRDLSGDSSMLASGRAEISESAKTEFNKLLELRLLERDLRFRFGARHHRVVRAREGIEEMEAFLTRKRRETERAYVQLLLNDLRDLRRREKEYRKKYEVEKQAALRLVQAELDDQDYRNRLQSLDASYARWDARLKEAGLTSSYGEFSSRSLASVKLGEPVSPNRVLAMVLGVAVGLFFGLGLAVVADFVAVSGVSTVKRRVNLRQPAYAAESQPVQHIPVSV